MDLLRGKVKSSASTSIIIIVRIQTPASSRVYACINAKWWPRGSHLTWMETTNTFVFESVPLRFVSRFLSFSREKKKEGFQMFFLGFNSASFEAQVEDVIEERILRGKQAKKQLPENV